MKEVEKAKKEAAKFKTKRDKEKEKEKGKDRDPGDRNSDPDDFTINLLKRNSTPYSYKPPPYTLHSAPSVSQLVYQPPSLERFKSVRYSSNAVTTLALSLEPTQSTNADMLTPPSSPPDNMLYHLRQRKQTPPKILIIIYEIMVQQPSNRKTHDQDHLESAFSQTQAQNNQEPHPTSI
jgi:hypothetical protein